MKQLSLLLFAGGSYLQIPAEIAFNEIAPIIHQNCSTCHNPDGIGPFSLITYEDITKRARQMSEVVQSGYMPPWQTDPHYSVGIIGERILSTDEISLIREWAAQQESSSSLPPEDYKYPVFNNKWALGEPDLVLKLPEPYSLSEQGIDVYRNFVIPLPIEVKRYVRALDIRPNTRLAIHHALITIDKSEHSRSQELLDPEPGFDGMGIGTAQNPSGHFIGWTPGQVPYECYPGTAWELFPGDDLVLQLHMLPTGKPEAIDPEVGIYFSEKPPELLSMILQLRNFDIDIPAGEQNYRVYETMDVPVDIQIIGVYPHAHYLGKSMELSAITGEGQKIPVLRIPQWDFNWQSDYRFKEPIGVPAGSKLVMDYTYDNSDENIFNPNHPARRVVGGWRSEDEMAEAVFQVIVETETDLRTLEKAQIAYDVDAAGGEANYLYYLATYQEQQNLLQSAYSLYERALVLDESFASAHYKLGVLDYQFGDIVKAEKRIELALNHNPRLVAPKLLLAQIAANQGDVQRAAHILKELIDSDPDIENAYLQLAALYSSINQPAEAFLWIEKGVTELPDSLVLKVEYAVILFEQNNYIESLTFLSEIIEVSQVEEPGSPAQNYLAVAHLYRGRIFNLQNKAAEALGDFQQAVSLAPKQHEPHKELILSYQTLNRSEKLKDSIQDFLTITSPDDYIYYDLFNKLDRFLYREMLIQLVNETMGSYSAYQICEHAINQLFYPEDSPELETLKKLRREFLMQSL